MRLHRTTTLALVGCLALFGCKKTEETPAAVDTSTATSTTVETTPASVPFKVTSVDVGKGIGSDKKITDSATTFKPKDTIYASVATQGTAPTAKVKATWSYGDNAQVVDENEVTITPNGPVYTEFHIAKANGFPVGKYKVEIFVDGTSAATKEFEVKK